MDVDGARRQVQTPDRLGQIPAPHWASSKLIPARYNFHRARQTQGESVDEFISRCRVLAAKCKFADILEVNTHLIEQLIAGTKHVAVQEKLLEKGDALASLDAALDIARTYEATKAHVAQLQATPATAEVVHDFGTRRPKRQDDSCTRRADWTMEILANAQRMDTHVGSAADPTTGHNSARPNEMVDAEHPLPALPINVQLSSEWRSKDTRQRGYRQPWNPRISDCQCGQHQRWPKGAYASLRLVTLSLSIVKDKRPTALKAKVDTGGQANILPLRIYQQMDLPENSLKPSTTTLVWYTGTPIPPHGLQPILHV